MDALDYLLRGAIALAVFGAGVLLARIRWARGDDEPSDLGLD